MDRKTPLQSLTLALKSRRGGGASDGPQFGGGKGGAERMGPKLAALSEYADFVLDALAAARARDGLLGRSFWALVVLPTACFWLYSALWQSPRYVAETKLTVREAQKREPPKMADAASMVARMMDGMGSRDSQNAYMVLGYIKSRAIIEDLGGRAYFERKFSGKADYFSRLGKGADLEDLWKFWLSHVSASVENLSGILTVRIDAFLPEDAQNIVKDVVRLSEDLINRITLRNRADALARAESEVTLARRRLADAREKTLDFRNRNFVIDPESRATSLGELIGKLTLERIDLVNALSTFSSSLALDAPSQRLQRLRLAAIDQQIAELKKKLTDDEGSGAVADQMASYQNLKLEEQFAERLYAIAQSAYESARGDLERQQLYLVTVVRPTLPEVASYPRVTANTALLFGSLLIAWGIVSLVVASIDDQMT